MIKLTKVNKSHTEFEDQEPGYGKKLELYDPSKNSNKFWHIWVYGPYVVRWRGKHGTKGQWYVHRAESWWRARDAAHALVRAKAEKGYVKDTTTVLDRLAREV
jgi:predicted DNA-binding WGR domain protein